MIEGLIKKKPKKGRSKGQEGVRRKGLQRLEAVQQQEKAVHRDLQRAKRSPSMVGKKKGKEGPGQALIKQRSRASQSRSGASGEARQVLESITHVTDLEEVLEQAEHAGRIFSALHPLPQVLIANDDAHGEFARLDANEKKVQQRLEEALHESSLTVPRRPKWHVGMSPEELDAQERAAFLEWRRGLVRLEDNEKLVITPFEKNLDIWRQLWRVIERCHLVVMVVDARNPLFYRCPDLEAYIAEIDKSKRTILLLNKADLIPAPIRSKWAKYLKSQGIKFLFWSAKDVNILLEKNGHVNMEETQPRTLTGRSLEQHDTNYLEEDVRILGREELLHKLQCEAEIVANHCEESTHRSQKLDSNPRSDKPLSHQQIETEDGDANEKEWVQLGVKHVAVGFVGYPNVGKSSTINALVGGKRTGVTSTPGKTKHFQTLIINDRLVLCDCPGLVFPSFTSSKSEMVASGVLPIDRMTDYRGPIQVLADQIPRATLEKTYGISLPSPKLYEPQDRPPSAAEFLRAYALSRGYVISSGLPDETRSARQILKDYLNGKLLYCHTPPDENQPIPELHNDEGSDGSEEEGPASLESKKGDKDVGENSGLTEAQKELFLDGQTISPANWSKLDGIFGDVEPPDVRDGSRARLPSFHKMRKKIPRKKDRSWRAKDDDCNGMTGIRGVSKPVSHGAARLGEIIS